MRRFRAVFIMMALVLVLFEPTFGQYPAAFPRAGAVKVFENERVVVWDVTWAKGQPTSIHEHPRDSMSVTLVPGTLSDVSPDGMTESRTAGFGDFRFQAKGRVHREEGASDPSRRAIVIELK